MLSWSLMPPKCENLLLVLNMQPVFLRNLESKLKKWRIWMPPQFQKRTNDLVQKRKVTQKYEKKKRKRAGKTLVRKSKIFCAACLHALKLSFSCDPCLKASPLQVFSRAQESEASALWQNHDKSQKVVGMSLGVRPSSAASLLLTGPVTFADHWGEAVLCLKQPKCSPSETTSAWEPHIRGQFSDVSWYSWSPRPVTRVCCTYWWKSWPKRQPAWNPSGTNRLDSIVR